MKFYNYRFDEKKFFTYDEFCDRYDGVGLKEYIKSILVIQYLSVKAQKIFFSSQLPHFKKVYPFLETCNKYVDTIGDNLFEYNISCDGAGSSSWRCGVLSPPRFGMLSFWGSLLGGSLLDAFVFIDDHLKIVKSSFLDIQKRLFSNLLEIKGPIRYEFVNNVDGFIDDWFSPLCIDIRKDEISNVERLKMDRKDNGKDIYCECYFTELGCDNLIFTRGSEVFSVNRSIFYDNDSKRPCLSLFENNIFFPYSHRELQNHKDHNIVVSEKYEWIDSCCNCLAEDFSNAIFTWLNPEKNFLESDWSCLNGRDVTFVFQKDSVESASLALKFYKLCTGKNIKLTFVTYYYEGDEHSSKWWHKGNVLSIEELREFLRTNTAKNDEDSAKSCNSSDIKKPSDLEADIKSYLVETLFRPGDIVLLVAKQKVGKSLFSLDLSMMLSCGGLWESVLRLLMPKKSCM